VINEVQYDPVQVGQDAAFEWVELYNRTGGTYVLDNWSVTDNYSSDLIPSVQLSPGEFVVIAAGAGFYDNFPDFSGRIAFVDDGKIGNGLNNDGDSLCLADSTGRIIDALSYGDDDDVMLTPCPDVRAGHTLERQPAGLDTDRAGDFVDNGTPSPGYGLAAATPTPSPAPSLTPSPTPTPSPAPTPAPMLTPTPSPATTGESGQKETPTAVPTSAVAGSSTPGPSITHAPAFTATPSPFTDRTFLPTPANPASSGGSNIWIYAIVAVFFVIVAAAPFFLRRLRRRD
jgi:hypothetical protein